MISRLRALWARDIDHLSLLVCLETVEYHVPAAQESVPPFLAQNEAGFFFWDCLAGRGGGS